MSRVGVRVTVKVMVRVKARGPKGLRVSDPPVAMERPLRRSRPVPDPMGIEPHIKVKVKIQIMARMRI